jgi:hypothetical protein
MEDGTGTMTMIFGDEIEEAPLTWDDSKSQICIMGDCLSYKIDGDSFTIDQPVEAFCSDDNSEETNHDTQSTCETSGNTWTKHLALKWNSLKNRINETIPSMRGLFALYINAVYAWPLNLTDTSFETPFCSIVTPYK